MAGWRKATTPPGHNFKELKRDIDDDKHEDKWYQILQEIGAISMENCNCDTKREIIYIEHHQDRKFREFSPIQINTQLNKLLFSSISPIQEHKTKWGPHNCKFLVQ